MCMSCVSFYSNAVLYYFSGESTCMKLYVCHEVLEIFCLCLVAINISRLIR